MASTTLIVRGSPLDPFFDGDLNELWQAMLDRLEVISPYGEVNVRIGGLMPTSNVGPWLNVKQWYVWDEDTTTYVPLDITDSLPQIDARVATVVAPMIAAALVGYATQAYVNTQISNLSFLSRFSVYTSFLVPLVTDGTWAKITWNSPAGNVGNNFNLLSNKYVAPSNGQYQMESSLRFDFLTGSLTDIVLGISLRVNGTERRVYDILQPSMQGATYGFSALINLVAGDEVEVYANCTASGVGTAQVTADLRKTYFDGFLLP